MGQAVQSPPRPVHRPDVPPNDSGAYYQHSRKHPLVSHIFQWVTRTSAYLDTLTKEGVAPYEAINGVEAGKLIGPSPPDHDVQSVQGEAELLGVKLGGVVSIMPSDTGMCNDDNVIQCSFSIPGKIPTVGKLVALNREEVVVETQGSAGRVHVHFPRLNFLVKPAPSKL